MRLRGFGQTLGVVQGSGRIVNGAGADNGQDAVVAPVQHVDDLLAGAENQR